MEAAGPRPVEIAQQVKPADPEAARPPKRSARRAPPEKPRPFRLEDLPARTENTADRQIPEPPPMIAATSQPARSVPVLTPRRGAPSLSALVSYEPVRPHALRKVVNKIPGLRALQRNAFKDGEEFSAATPVHRVAPPVPPGLKAANTELELKVLIDKEGKVRRTEVASDVWDPRLVRLAVNAAERWRFAPARLRDKAVESEMTLHFDFAPLGAGKRASAR
jgi:outer membrane biosynthesis protein TonB